MDLSGRVALVTGSATGVGRATALEFARRGAAVVINYSKSEAEAQRTFEDMSGLGADALLCRADVSRDAEVRDMVRQTVDRWGRLDFLVNNAATTFFVPFADLEGLTEEMWDRLLDVNVKGVFFCSRAAAKPMLAQGSGSIVNVSSQAGIRAVGTSIAYAASKAAVINLTVALARTLAPHVRVNCVAPGFIETRWLRDGIGEAYEAVKQRTAQGTPLQRVATPEDVAQVILNLSTAADFVTGQTVVVDGGYGIRG